MEGFRSKLFNVLIASNVLARGIDIPECNVVVNYDVPVIVKDNWTEPDYATYMHRVGRTGRFGTEGLSITFVTAGDNNEPDFVRKIEENYGIEIKKLSSF